MSGIHFVANRHRRDSFVIIIIIVQRDPHGELPIGLWLIVYVCICTIPIHFFVEKACITNTPDDHLRSIFITLGRLLRGLEELVLWFLGRGFCAIQIGELGICILYRLDSTTVVRLTPDQKVGSSKLSRVIFIENAVVSKYPDAALIYPFIHFVSYRGVVVITSA